MDLVAIAAFEIVILMAGMRIVLLVVSCEAPCGIHDVGHVVAIAVRAELFSGKLLARSEQTVFAHGVAVGNPCHNLGNLRGNFRLMTVEARIARFGVGGHKLARIAFVIRFDILVHGTVADGIAEAGLFVPYPESRACHHKHRRDHAHDNPFVLSGHLGRRLRRMLCIGNATAFGLAAESALLVLLGHVPLLSVSDSTETLTAVWG